MLYLLWRNPRASHERISHTLACVNKDGTGTRMTLKYLSIEHENHLCHFVAARKITVAQAMESGALYVTPDKPREIDFSVIEGAANG